MQEIERDIARWGRGSTLIDVNETGLRLLRIGQVAWLKIDDTLHARSGPRGTYSKRFTGTPTGAAGLKESLSTFCALSRGSKSATT
jgi:hypothetical protein